MRRHLAGLFVMFATVVASAAPAADRWTEIRSPHFIVLANSSERNDRHIATQMERTQKSNVCSDRARSRLSKSDDFSLSIAVRLGLSRLFCQRIFEPADEIFEN